MRKLPQKKFPKNSLQNRKQTGQKKKTKENLKKNLKKKKKSFTELNKQSIPSQPLLIPRGLKNTKTSKITN
jgi:hypothetical protein